MKIKLILLVLAAAILFASCKKEEEPAAEEGVKTYVINEVFQTPRDEMDNVDSPAFYQTTDGENWIIATAKEGDVLIVNNAETGEEVKRTAGSGTKLGMLERPNGISVIDDLAVIVERDNHRVQVFSLPGFESLGSIAGDKLIKPYGLYIYKLDGKYRMFVTDNYETADEQVPPPSELDKRIYVYDFTVEDGELKSEFVKTFGDTSGAGVLSVVESIYGDAMHNNLLLSEEDVSQSSVKVYDLDGNFTGKVFGKGLFKYQVEGIALHECENGKGYWIITDQSLNGNRFMVFERETFEHIGNFTGPKTTNTDGIWLTQTSYGQFDRGAFFAVHNDGNVSAFDWGEIADSLGINLTCE